MKIGFLQRSLSGKAIILSSRLESQQLMDNRKQTQLKFQSDFFSHNNMPRIFLPVFTYILHLQILWFDRMTVCANIFLYLLFLLFLYFCLFVVLSLSDFFVLFCYPLDICLFYKETERGWI